MDGCLGSVGGKYPKGISLDLGYGRELQCVLHVKIRFFGPVGVLSYSLCISTALKTCLHIQYSLLRDSYVEFLCILQDKRWVPSLHCMHTIQVGFFVVLGVLDTAFI